VVDLNHGKNLRHLVVLCSGIKQSEYKESKAVNHLKYISNAKGQEIQVQWIASQAWKSNDLEDVKRIPLTPPKVDMATKTGTIQAQFPYSLSANVTPTASAPSTSLTDSVEWKATMVIV